MLPWRPREQVYPHQGALCQVKCVTRLLDQAIVQGIFAPGRSILLMKPDLYLLVDLLNGFSMWGREGGSQ